MNIICPVAGKSSRFPNVRPKWLLTNPNGNLMIVDAIINLQLKNIDNIYIIYLKEHEDKFQFKEGLIKNFKKYKLDLKLKFIKLDSDTDHQVETVRRGLKIIGDDIPFLIKDCDNSFVLSDVNIDHNFVTYFKINNLKTSDISSKSYLQIDKLNNITNIAEKKIISNMFCCGGYYFNSSHEFLKYSEINIKNAYISDIVYNMILHGKIFKGIETSDYNDWGTISEWNKYKKKFLTLFIDIDGVLLKNSSEYFPPYIGNTSELTNNIQYIKKLISTKKVQIILTTSRPESCREITEMQLKQLEINYTHLLMGLQHCNRIIINDFSNTNLYKTCDSINIPRDSDTLENYLDYEL